VEIKNEPLRMAHLAQLFRLVAGVRFSLSESGVRENSHSLERSLYLHGALLGPSASQDVLMAEAMMAEESPGLGLLPSICVGCVSEDPERGVQIQRIWPSWNYSSGGADRFEEESTPLLKKVAGDLLGAAPMWSEWTAALREEEEERRCDDQRTRLLRRMMRAGIAMSAEDLARIDGCADRSLLEQWIRNVELARTADEVFWTL
jgi:hypothetical protein